MLFKVNRSQNICMDRMFNVTKMIGYKKNKVFTKNVFQVKAMLLNVLLTKGFEIC